MFGKVEAHLVDPGVLQRMLEDSGVSYKTNKRSYIFQCPRCGKRDKLMMLKASGRFICWVCAETSNFRGRPEYALVELLGVSFKEVCRKLYGDPGAYVQTDVFSVNLLDFYADDEPIPEDLIEQQRGVPFPLDFYPLDHPFAANGLEYVLGRGISYETAKRYDLRYCPVQKRVIFPIKVGSKLLGWQARFILPSEWYDEEGNRKKVPKILTTGPRDAILMFQDNLVGSEHAIICEGPVDALKCELAGGNVATMGKVVSERQIKLIKGSGVRRVYVGLDKDAATETMKLAKALTDYPPGPVEKERGLLELYRLLPAPGYEDLGAMPPELVLAQFNSAPRLNSGGVVVDVELPSAV